MLESKILNKIIESFNKFCSIATYKTIKINLNVHKLNKKKENKKEIKNFMK